MTGIQLPTRLARTWEAVRQEMELLDPQYASN